MKKMTKQEFMAKHDFNELDFRNLKRYEQVRTSGGMNMFEYLAMMKSHNLNGGSKLASWILVGTNYAEFREVLKNERTNKRAISTRNERA